MAKTRITARPPLVPIDGFIPPDPNLQSPRTRKARRKARRKVRVIHPNPQHPSNQVASPPRHVNPPLSPQASPPRSVTPPHPRQASPPPRSVTPPHPRQASPPPRHVTPPHPRQASPPRNRNPPLHRQAPPSRNVNPPRPGQVPRGNAGGIRRPGKQSRRGGNSLRDIRKFQNNTDFLIKRAPFTRLVREIAFTYKPDVRFVQHAITALQEAAEIFFSHYFEAAYSCTAHAKRVTLMSKDLFLAKRVTSYNLNFDPSTWVKRVPFRVRGQP